MAFDDTNRSQRELITRLVQNLASADFAPRFTVTPLEGASYSVGLKGVGGATDIEIVSENDHFEKLRDSGYVSMVPSGSGYIGGLTAKAYEEIKTLEVAPSVFGFVPANDHEGSFDDELLERIAARSERLLRDLRKNFELYRRQAFLSFIWTLVISTVGMILLSTGVGLSLAGKASTVNLASISGVLTEFLAAVFFRQATAARNAQDRCQQALLERQRILDLVEFTRFISDENTRDAVTQDLIRSFVLGNVSPQH
jgi:hypothetical protein